MNYKSIILDYLKNKNKEYKKRWLEQMKTTCEQWAKNHLLVDSADREIAQTIKELIDNEH